MESRSVNDDHAVAVALGLVAEREDYRDVGTIDAEDVRPTYPEAWRVINDVQLMELADPHWAIRRILPDRGVAVFYGPSGACKTTLIAAVLGCQATGRDFYGSQVDRVGPSLYVAAEDVAGFKVRVGAWKRSQRLSLTEPIGIHTFPEPINLLEVAAVARFERFLLESAIGFQTLVIDTYAASTPGANENSSEDVTIALQHGRQWSTALGCLVVFVHHTNAGGTRERGHSGLRAGVDTMISLTPVDDVIHVECSKQRNAAQFEPLTLKLVPVPGGEGCVLRAAADVLPTSDLTTTQQKALVALRETFPHDGATKAEWQRACHDVAERSFHRAAKMLAERGHVRQVGTHFRVTGGGQ
jgi:hypothetical protein